MSTLVSRLENSAVNLAGSVQHGGLSAGAGSVAPSLIEVEQAVEVYHDEEYKSKRWHFPSHNYTLSVIWTPFLVKSVVFEDNDGISTSETELHLDLLNMKWREQYNSFDYVVTAGGKWFLKTAVKALTTLQKRV